MAESTFATPTEEVIAAELAAWRKQFEEGESWTTQARKAAKKAKKEKKKERKKRKKDDDDRVARVAGQVVGEDKDVKERAGLLVERGLGDDDEIVETLVSEYRRVGNSRKGFSDAELAAQRWRQAHPRRRRRSPSFSRSRSSSVDSVAPADPRPREHCDRRTLVKPKYDINMPPWHHDKFAEVLREPSPEPYLPPDYVPPEPEWFSRAGGVCIPNPRAWINQAREARAREGDDDDDDDDENIQQTSPHAQLAGSFDSR